MHVTFRLHHLTGALLLAAAPFAGAGPLPDPVAPAVIGRPLDQIRPARAVHHHAAVSRPRLKPHKQLAASSQPVRPHAQAVTLAPPAARTRPAALAPAAPHAAAAPQHAATQAITARPAPRTQVLGNAGASTRVVARTLGPGAYFSSSDQALVRKYYAAHPASGAAQWKIGEPIPPQSVLTGVPDDLRASLSPLPVGHQYVEVDGDVVLVAVQSRVVVDGVSRGVH